MISPLLKGKEQSAQEKWLIFRFSNAYSALHLDSDSISVESEGGYYGEEVSTITFCGFTGMFKEKLVEFLSWDLTSQVQYLLQMEYDFVLPDVEKWELRLVPTKSITEFKAPKGNNSRGTQATVSM